MNSFAHQHGADGKDKPQMIEPLFLTTARVTTFDGDRVLTGASGFFFERSRHLFLVSSRHVFHDPPTNHHPNRIEIELHTDSVDLTRSSAVSIWLFKNGRMQWRQGFDSGGDIDVAAIEIDRALLPATTEIRCFTPAHLQSELDRVEVGRELLVVGFPLGFHDTLHHLPVARHAVIASAFGIRFQGQGFFLTDSRTHRGTSGAPVVMHDLLPGTELPWRLLGVHSSRFDMSTRDLNINESLGLNAAWYADFLLTLTDPARPQHDEQLSPAS